jgi:methionyl-tRNA formyltransferase
MRLVFLGSPPFATPILERLLSSERHEVLALVTPPDRPRGRGRAVVRSALAKMADEADVQVVQPASTKDPAFLEALAGFEPEVLMVASYGEILRTDVLELCPHGALNVHGSLLPRWRGASPIQRAIAAGDAETGVSIQRMVLALDAGDVLLEKRTSIGPQETAADLFERLSLLGADAAEEALDLLAGGDAVYTPQDESLVTLAPKLTKDDGRIDFTLPAAAIARHVRAMTTWPGARTTLPDGRDLVVLEARPEQAGGAEAPGTLLDGATLLVRTGDGEAVRLARVKPAGKAAMADDAFQRGARVEPGAVLGG